MWTTILFITLGITDLIMVNQHGDRGDLVETVTGIHTESNPYVLLLMGIVLGGWLGYMPRKDHSEDR